MNDAMSAWGNLLSPVEILTGDEATSRYGRCTTGAQRKLAGALIPEHRHILPDIVRVAAAQRIPLYPISTGHNWGYGTALPAVDGCVILDLSKLNKIISFDPELGLLSIEPGVTQKDLCDFLEKGNHPFLVPVTGAGPSCSLLGNALERGYGITPYADHFGALMSLECVLPNGQIYRGSLSSLGGNTVEHAFKWGIGAYLDGLFTQSAFGIVTEITIALARRPECTKAFLFGLKDPSRIGELVQLVQRVISTYPGVVGAINLMNAHRVLAMSVPYPRDGLGADGLIREEVIETLGKSNQIMSWTGFGTLYGSQAVVKAAQREIRSILGPVASRLIFVSPKQANILARLTTLLPQVLQAKIGRSAHMLAQSLQLVAGRPNETAMPLCYWKSGGLPLNDKTPLDPARDGCGVIWFAPLVPMKHEVVTNFIEMATTIMRRHAIEPLITLTSLSERCFDSTIPILFDLDDEAQIKAAEACHDELFIEGRKRGFVPYRVGIQTMDKITGINSTYWDLVRQIKSSIDPHGIISPGRYS